MKRLTLLFSLLFMCVSLAFSQRQVTGTVEDNSGNPIPGASVIVVGTSSGTVTDIDGNFAISVSSGDQLEFSFVGYESQTVTVGAQSTLTISLVESTEFLDEIVVSGYQTQTRKSLSGAIASVDVNNAVKTPVINVAEMLQGRVTGVSVINSGQPGAAPIVRVRGYGTPNNNSPLYVIDGVQTDDAYVLSSLSPSDIEQINVLKDASAAIYGARASNGVIVITTKGGSYNTKSTVTFESYVGSSRAVGLPTLLNAQQHADMIWQSKINDGVAPNHPQYGTGGSPNVPSSLQGTPAGISTTVAPNGTDWLDAIFDPGLAQQYKFSVTSGNANSKFMMSMEYLDRQGAQIMTGYKTGRTRMNAEFKVNDRITIGEHLNVTYDSERATNQVQAAYRSSPLIPLYDNDGNFAGGYGTPLGLGNVQNPYAVLKRTEDDFQKSFRAFGDVYANVNIIKGLDYKVVFGGMMRDLANRRFVVKNPEHSEPRSTNTLYEQSFRQYNWNLTNTLNYKANFDNHSIDALLGYEALSNNFKGHEISRNDYLFETPNFYLLSNGAGTPVVQYANASAYTISSIFLTVNYAYNNRYFVTATVRQDNTSRFSKANADAIFPSASFGWVLSEEDFYGSDNYMKLRVSYGTLGNQSLGRTAPDQNISNLSEANAYYPFDGSSISTGAALSAVGNPDLQWETVVSANAGLDFRLMDNKLYGSVDYFNITTNDLIAVDESLIGTTAIDASAPLVNIGQVSNTGIELALNYADQTSGGLSYDVGFNFSTYKNVVDSLISAFYVGNSSFRGGAVTRTASGEPMSYFYGRRVLGLDGSGRFEYADINGDGSINDDDREKIGSPHPDFTFGLNVSLGYKNFDLYAFFAGSVGNEIYHYNKIYSHFPTFFNGNRHEDVLDSWTPSNTDTDMPALSESIRNEETQPNSWFVEDGSYVKLKTLQIGYTLPSSATSKLGISNARIYVAGNNLLTLSKYSGMDPEVGGGPLTLGVDQGIYPQASITSLGINVTF